MIRISYPKEKIVRLGLETQAYCFKISSPNFDAISLASKILTQLDKEAEFYYRATGTCFEMEKLKEYCEEGCVLINEYYEEKNWRKNRYNMELCARITHEETLTNLLMNWVCSPKQDKNIFVTSSGGGERVFITLQATNHRYDLTQMLWPYLHAYVECDPYAKWNTFTITVPTEYKEQISSIIQSYKVEKRKVS